MTLKEKTNTIFLIRKSFIDETTELARCSKLDLAVSMCKPGYSIYDEDGNLLHTTIDEDISKYSKTWNLLKSKVEKQILHINGIRFPFISMKEINIILSNATEILQLMNKIEVEESRNA